MPCRVADAVPGGGRGCRDRALWHPGSTRPLTTGAPAMAKKARKRRARKKSGANHGKRPNA